MLEIVDAPGVFVDAHLVDEGRLRFMSVWGRDTALQSFLARLSLSETEGGLSSFQVGNGTEIGSVRIHCPDPSVLSKITSRKPGTIFGELINIWLYDRLAVEPDQANARALIMSTSNPDEDTMWTMLKQVLWLPLLDNWRDIVIERFTASARITTLDGFNLGACQIDLSNRDEIEEDLSRWIRQGDLPIQ